MDDLVQALSVCLANAHVFQMKAHNFHWNTQSHVAHLLFDRIYGIVYNYTDRLAEFLGGYGVIVPASLSSYLSLTGLTESVLPSDKLAMISTLLADNAVVVEALKLANQKATRDPAAMNLLGDLLEEHSTIQYLLIHSVSD